MVHRNAPLTPEGRRRLCERVEAGRPISHVAAEAGIARKTLGYWYGRWLAEGEDGLEDRSSRPHRSPNQTSAEVEARVYAMRRELKVGPVQLAGRLAEEGLVLPASTIYRILVRHGISRLRDLDVSGEDLREPVVRYEYHEPGGMIHVDVKKLGRIPAGGGWRVHGRGSARHRAGEKARHANARARRKGGGRPSQLGYVYLHTAIDDHSRLAYTEELLDEKGATAAGFWGRAVKFFRRHGIRRIKRVLTDNGACYRSHLFNAALAKTRTRHKYTRPYRPQTNGKVERYHRTLAREWAYQQAWTDNHHRSTALPAFLDRYNYTRPHTALAGRPPVTRTPGVTNLAV
ncbi:IS481 family transposase [Nocardioides sp. GXZ039]|uniref:IS481 family transposase n=1 Tax=Nocardioides sp. GXZ039 TaxID=3136018 RepID=UPI0030F483E1